MRYLMNFKLQDGTSLTAVAFGRSEGEAVKIAIEVSNKCFNKKSELKFKLTKDTPVYSEKWLENGKHICQSGDFHCNVMSYYTNTGVKGATFTKLKGVKSAFNFIYNSNNKNPLVTFIYDLNQVSKKPISLASSKAKQVTNDEKKTKKLLEQVTNKLEQMPGGAYLADVPLLCSMILDYSKHYYKEIPVSVIVGITGALIYFASPADVIPDVIPCIGQIDDMGVIIWTLKQFHKEIQDYRKWKLNNTNNKGVK